MDVGEILVIVFLVLVFDFELTAVLGRLVDDEESSEDDEAEVDVVTVASLDRLVDDEGSWEDDEVDVVTVALLDRLVEDETLCEDETLSEDDIAEVGIVVVVG